MRARARNGDRKTQQLCRQVERQLSLVFSGELEDPLLEGLVICSVRALDGPSLLQVEVHAPKDADGQGRDVALVLARLHAAKPWLRQEIAAAICRKRTPQLIFSLASPESFHHCEE